MIAFPSWFAPIRPQRVLLLSASALATILGIFLQNSGVLPTDETTFFFLSFVLLLFALYRPGWTFLLFVGFIPLEIINVAPMWFGGLALRPYQWLAGILFLAVGIRFFAGRLPFQMFRPGWIDILPVLVALGGFSALVSAPDQALALKQSLIVVSFVGVYFLGRIFFRTLYDVRQAVPFLLVSSIVISGYALWQNIRFRFGQESFQVMVGRPNGTFSEADWLGMFAVAMLGVGLSLLFRQRLLWRRPFVSWRTAGGSFLLYSFLTITLITLILSMARSAWLGAAALAGVFFFMVLFSDGWRGMRKQWRRILFLGGVLCISLTTAVGAVSFFELSPFPLLHRIQSTGGLQVITIACDVPVALPETIADISELAQFHCRHIDLEAIERELAAGQYVAEIKRPDPNVAIRKGIYGDVLGVLRTHFLTGIGWGSVALFLGTDERGAGLNASNVFLEVWLGSGLFGALSFLFLWVAILWFSFRWFHQATDAGEKAFALFLCSTHIGLLVFNLFNSGILLGFFFLFLSVGALAVDRQNVVLKES